MKASATPKMVGRCRARRLSPSRWRSSTTPAIRRARSRSPGFFTIDTSDPDSVTKAASLGHLEDLRLPSPSTRVTRTPSLARLLCRRRRSPVRSRSTRAIPMPSCWQLRSPSPSIRRLSRSTPAPTAPCIRSGVISQSTPAIRIQSPSLLSLRVSKTSGGFIIDTTEPPPEDIGTHFPVNHSERVVRGGGLEPPSLAAQDP